MQRESLQFFRLLDSLFGKTYTVFSCLIKTRESIKKCRLLQKELLHCAPP